jgi:hypothetical protein
VSIPFTGIFLYMSTENSLLFEITEMKFKNASISNGKRLTSHTLTILPVFGLSANAYYWSAA